MECWAAVELEKDALARFVRHVAEVVLDPLLDHVDVRSLGGVVGAAARLRKMKKRRAFRELPLQSPRRGFFFLLLGSFALRADDDYLLSVRHYSLVSRRIT